MITSHEERSPSLCDSRIGARTITIVGNPGQEHVGAHFLKAARQLSIAGSLLDAADAYRTNAWVAKANWWLCGRRPTHLGRFSSAVQQSCAPGSLLLITGIGPVNRDTLVRLGKTGVCRCNFLTDDPWNRAHYAPWFFKALPHYDFVFTPRRRNMQDLRNAGCRRVVYLPFGYSPEVHLGSPSDYVANAETDVLFAGGADGDRVPWIRALCDSGLCVRLYGGYWDRIPQTAAYARGIADLATLKSAVLNAKITLCLVRKANRDGHAMRSFEVPANGGCMLAEDTQDHRELFGNEGEAVLYFKNVGEMQAKAGWLLERPAERRRLAYAAHSRIAGGAHTYADRLKTILKQIDV